MSFFPASVNKQTGVGASCLVCGAYKTVQSPALDPYGANTTGIMVIGEAPGPEEDRLGAPWQGRAGQYLRRELQSVGVCLAECVSLNAVNCFPHTDEKKVRKPTTHELDNCWHVKVKPALQQYNPSMVLVCGSAALGAVVGRRWQGSLGGIERWRGLCIPDREYKTWICPVFHPSFVLRMSDSLASSVFRSDLERAVACVGRPVPEYPEPGVEHIDRQVGDRLYDFCMQEKREGGLVSFDYETTGLKPYAPGHKILCIGVARESDRKVCVARVHTEEDLRGWVAVLKDGGIQKTAHNMKFEELWSREILGSEVRGWRWDSMLAAHVLDARRGHTGLKFQTYANFGVVDYIIDIERCLEVSTSHAHNDAERFMRGDGGKAVMEYCARDCYYQLMLAARQRRDIENHPVLSRGYALLHRGMLAFGHMERLGVRIDAEAWEKAVEKVEEMLAVEWANFQRTDLYQQWEREYGSGINVQSGAQMRRVLYERMGVEPVKTTPSGAGSTDEDSLSKLGLVGKGIEHILTMRKLRKVRETYLANWQGEAVGGEIHPFYNLHSVRTYRSSCDRPNFQNVPKHDQQAYSLCRGVIYPRIGHQFLEADYSGIEVRMAACITEDERLLNDVLTGDMHRDMAIELYRLQGLDKRDKGEAMLRQGAKNGFVFPQFYGDYWKSCVPLLLEWAARGSLRDGTPALQHLSDCRLVRLGENGQVVDAEAFALHVQSVERDFWERRYYRYGKWREDTWRAYNRNAEMVVPTGFLIRGMLSRNECLNAPIQAASFHLLLWSVCRIQERLFAAAMQTGVAGQVHDSVLLDVWPSEMEEVVGMVRNVMEQEVKQTWPWVTVPLEVEVEAYQLDGPWLGGETVV